MYKLMIVDDEEEVRTGIIRKIDWAGFNFEVPAEAENGREALNLIEENIPDVIITDIAMPLMDGLELSSVISESYPTIKIVILLPKRPWRREFRLSSLTMTTQLFAMEKNTVIYTFWMNLSKLIFMLTQGQLWIKTWSF